MLFRSESKLQRYLGRLQTRSTLSTDEQDAILMLPCRQSEHRNGHDIIARGTSIQTIYVVVDGLVGSFALNNEGTRQITALHIRGDMADSSSATLRRSSSGLCALSAVTLIEIALDDLDDIGMAHPAVARAMWRDGAADASIQAEWTFNVGTRSARARLAHLICEMALRYERAGYCVGLSFEFPITQENLADATAMTSVHLNWVMMGLRRDGIIDMRHHTVHILDWGALIREAQFDDGYMSIMPGFGSTAPSPESIPYAYRMH